MTDKPHWNTGNQYAAKEKRKEAHIHIRCEPEFKSALVKAAQSEGKNLAGFITDKLSSVPSVKKILNKIT